MKPISNHKQICRDLAPNDFHYAGFWDGYYHFQRGDYSEGFTLMSCLEEDLCPENLQSMADKGLTRAITNFTQV